MILATHSPEVLLDLEPDQVLELKKDPDGSSMVTSHLDELPKMRAALRALDVPLTKVFGPEHVIWVEGETEEECFPRVLRRLRPKLNIDRTHS